MIKTMLLTLGLSFLILPSASAQTKPVTTLGSLDNVLQAGYEIKSVIFIPAAQAKDIFGANYPADSAQTLITLQKGSSVAVCIIASLSWATLADVGMTEVKNGCEIR
jgi:hypothetical protein